VIVRSYAQGPLVWSRTKNGPVTWNGAAWPLMRPVLPLSLTVNVDLLALDDVSVSVMTALAPQDVCPSSYWTWALGDVRDEQSAGRHAAPSRWPEPEYSTAAAGGEGPPAATGEGTGAAEGTAVGPVACAGRVPAALGAGAATGPALVPAPGDEPAGRAVGAAGWDAGAPGSGRLHGAPCPHRRLLERHQDRRAAAGGEPEQEADQHPQRAAAPEPRGGDQVDDAPPLSGAAGRRRQAMRDSGLVHQPDRRATGGRPV